MKVTFGAMVLGTSTMVFPELPDWVRISGGGLIVVSITVFVVAELFEIHRKKRS